MRDNYDIHKRPANQWLAVARLCLDYLHSGRARHEHYVGPWLPEPVLDHAALAADDYAHDLSVALMLTPEHL